MKFRSTTVATLLTAALASTAGAQQRADFSGVWTRSPDSVATGVTVAATGDATFRRGDMGSGWGSPLTIRQQASRLTAEYQVFSAYDLQPPLQFTYTLDGTPSVNSIMMGHATSRLESTTSWNGPMLVIETIYPGPTGRDGKVIPVAVRQSLHLTSPTTLVIETVRAGILGAGATTTRITYTKR